MIGLFLAPHSMAMDVFVTIIIPAYKSLYCMLSPSVLWQGYGIIMKLYPRNSACGCLLLLTSNLGAGLEKVIGPKSSGTHPTWAKIWTWVSLDKGQHTNHYTTLNGHQPDMKQKATAHYIHSKVLALKFAKDLKHFSLLYVCLIFTFPESFLKFLVQSVSSDVLQ